MRTVGIDNEELHVVAVGIGVKVLGTIVGPAEGLEVRSAGGELDTIASIEIGNPEFGFIDIGSEDVGETEAVSGELRLSSSFGKDVRGLPGSGTIQGKSACGLAINKVDAFARRIRHGSAVGARTEGNLAERTVGERILPEIADAARGAADIEGFPGNSP